MEGSQHTRDRLRENGHGDVGKRVAQRSGHLTFAFRGMANPSRKRHHENRQAWKNAERTKVGMAEFELWLNVDNYT